MEQNQRIVQEPIFIVGAERSGTTLMLLLLNHHPELCFFGEFDFAIQCMPEGNPPEMEKFHEVLREDRIFLHHQLEIDPDLNFEALVNSFLIQEREKSGNSRIGASIHFNYGNILKVWPKAKLIHLVRDPRDVASSCIQRGWAGNVWCAIDRWVDSESKWDKIVSFIPKKQLLEIKFEALVEDTQQTLSDICSFIGVSYSDKMLNYHKNSTYAAVDSSIAQKWPKKLNDHEIQLIETKVGSLLERKGYAPSGKPEIRVDMLLVFRLKLQNAYATRVYRVKKYGFKLWALRGLTKALGLKTWNEQIMLEFRAVKQKHLK